MLVKQNKTGEKKPQSDTTLKELFLKSRGSTFKLKLRVKLEEEEEEKGEEEEGVSRCFSPPINIYVVLREKGGETEKKRRRFLVVLSLRPPDASD